MTVTHTSTTNSLCCGSTILAAQEQPTPVQHFRVGTDGAVIPVEAEWDKQLQQFCFRVDELQHHLGVQVDHVKRAETGAYVNRLRYNDVICEPSKYPVSTGILEVYTNAKQSPSRSINDDYESSKVIELIDRLHGHIHAASRAGLKANAAEYQIGLEQHYPALIHHQSDAANITAVKTRELLLYPVPRRFFVVLRHKSRLLKTPLFRHLQLHLLCECGIYDDELDSVLEESTVPADIHSALEVTNDDDALGPTRTHLSSHPGYRIKEPTAFCKDLGSHLLPVLKFLHYSAIFAGIVVPALASVNVSGWFTVAQSFVNYNNTSWSEPWLKTLDYVAGLCELQVHLREDESELTKDDIPRAIEYPEYRQYQIHLDTLDPRKVYGNLIPVFCNRTGRLKYVCKSHDDDPVRAEDNSFKYLRTLGNTVVLNRSKGEVTFKMDSATTTTKTFYRYLMATPSIRKVNINLGPGMTADDFKVLRKMLTEANIDNIGLNATDIVARPRPCYMEILKLMINHRCQSMTLTGFKEFYSQISGTKSIATTRLKSLSLLCRIQTSQWGKLSMILKLCPTLRTLTISSSYSDLFFDNIRSELSHLKRLEFTDVTYQTVIRTSKNSFQQTVYTTELVIKNPCDLSSLPKGIYSHLALLKLHWLPEPDGHLKAWLANIVRGCPRLLTLDLRVPLWHFLTWVTLLSGNFKTVNTRNATLDSRRMVRLQSAEEDHDVTMTIRFIGNNPGFDIKVEMTGTQQSNPALDALFRSHGPFIRSLVASHLFDDTLAQTIAESFQERGSKLELLNIDPSGLTDIKYLQDIVDQSPSLKEFNLSFSSLENSRQLDLAKECYRRYGNRLTGLLLRGSEQSSHWITNAIPLRSEFTAIRDFEISFEEGRGQFREEAELSQFLQFISSPGPVMVAPPPFKPLHSISLSNCEPTQEQWNRILFALDLGALRYLSVRDTNFDAQEMDWLIGRLPKPTAILKRNWSPPPLNELVIKNTTLVKDIQRLAQLETKLLLRAPGIRVIID
ncbi:hypothetical protein BGZ72_001493 [Mortierella alpina]|nr:hypothetical protein BGZ72_001493 [Mortierella alpina]